MPYIESIKKILQQASKPLSAKDISTQLELGGMLRKNESSSITQTQIRDRIRKDTSGEIETIESNPLTYQIKPKIVNLWILKTVSEDTKASQIDSYGDNLSEYYNYDNLVANSKQINANDLAILIDKEKILGFAKIKSINSTNGQKTIRRCPECPSTTIDKRKTKKPTYRCNKGHEFEIPSKEIKDVIKYSAHFSSFIPIGALNDDLIQLRPYYIQGYNQNMSMQKLDYKALALFSDLGMSSNNNIEHYNSIPLMPYQSYTEEDEEEYKVSDEDERETVKRGIKLRRGQQKFRDTLLKRYKNTCVVTGCKIVDILEAAHIRPYRGKNDNHPSNGLLLRADIHTLFDLNLIAIDPDTMKVHFHPRIRVEYAFYDGIILFNNELDKPNVDALASHYNNFKSGA